MTINHNGKKYPLRGGAWLDPMNSFLYTVVGLLGNGYYLCRENNGTEFALYLPHFDQYVPKV